ncbi:hypothetical protein C7974DRAFT_414085 [Boeremia exigua]|uniref:uncharacterized protein n=1 Tax=Boeremia exigua TaxID=749465 RepID=UPI001E8D58A3|nr:uncharacterized protein C7974DRAFT_414085 [Boeremia exigua]KAH6625585.1 hypothetical protein C7974DRAFT_414085 [Boeremia exigua]
MQDDASQPGGFQPLSLVISLRLCRMGFVECRQNAADACDYEPNLANWTRMRRVTQRETEDTWFRFLVKMTAPDSKSSYTWHEMTFFSRWTPNGCRMLCIGVPSLFTTLLQDSLSRMNTPQPPTEPYSLHVPVLEAIVAMQDLSLWSMRDIVRGIEKTRALALRGPEAFLPMHEGARHAIHAFEVLSVSVQTGEALQQNLAQLRPDPRSRRSSALVPHVAFQLQMLRNLLSRSQSNKERLQNEVAQAHNMIAQRDSQTMTKLGEAAKRDSGAMRTVAVVTMAFLPPTFLSAIFSMSFFNYTPPPASSGWSVSSSVWIYFLCAVPLTLGTLGVWFWGAWVGRWMRRVAGGKA